MVTIPEKHRRYIEQATDILKSAGCSECFVFGSIADGRATEDSDVDLTIRGLPPEKFFYVYGKLPEKIDLIDLDDGSRISERLLRRGVMTRVF